MPRPASNSHGQDGVIPASRVPSRSRVAIRVGCGVAALQSHLVGQMTYRRLDKESPGQVASALELGVDLDHPALDPVGVELRVDRAIERIGEIDPPAVAADLDHLRPAIEGSGMLGMAGTRDHAADAQLADQFWLKRVADVV